MAREHVNLPLRDFRKMVSVKFITTDGGSIVALAFHSNIASVCSYQDYEGEFPSEGNRQRDHGQGYGAPRVHGPRFQRQRARHNAGLSHEHQKYYTQNSATHNLTGHSEKCRKIIKLLKVEDRKQSYVTMGTIHENLISSL